MTFDEHRGVAVLFGGVTSFTPSYITSNETWEWDGTAWTQRFPAHSPPAGRLHYMAYDPDLQRTVLFGGSLGSLGLCPDNETWVWDGTDWTLLSSAGPSARYFGGMAYDRAPHKAVLFGGALGCFCTDGVTNETWELDGGAWALRPASGPSARENFALVYHAARESVLVVGGSQRCALDAMASTTWEWDGSAWAQVGAGAPANRLGHGMAFDASRGCAVLVGGQTWPDSVQRDDTWEMDPSGSWTLRPVTGPGPRAHFAMCYDSLRCQTVLFGGGAGSNLFADTWVYSGAESPSAAVAVGSTTACRGGTALFTASALGSCQLEFQWRHDGVPISAAANPSAATSSLVVSQVTTHDAGTYDCVVANRCGSVATNPVALAICASDLNCDGLTDFGDYLAFLNFFVVQDPRVDFNEDGVVDFADYLEFLNRYDAGC